MKYTIYQIKNPINEAEAKVYHNYLFSPLSWIDKVHFEYYHEVWTDEISVNLLQDDIINNTLDKIFEIFNINHPENFHGHSLSVSDIVELNGKYYYCNDFGWSEINI